MFYRLLLSSGQLEFLSDSKSGIDRMKCLSTLIEMSAVKESVYATGRPFPKSFAALTRWDWYHPKRATEHLSIPFCAWTPSSWTANPSETDVAEDSLL